MMSQPPTVSFLTRVKRKIACMLPYGLVTLWDTYASPHKHPLPPAHWKVPQRTFNECLVIASGASILTQLESIAQYAARADVITVNESLQNPAVRALRPYAHVLGEPNLFSCIPPGAMDAYLLRLKTMFSLVDWPLVLYIPEQHYTKAVSLYYDNSCLSFAAVPPHPFPSDLPMEAHFNLLEQGHYGCGNKDALVAGLYLAVTAQYAAVWLAGADGDFLRHLAVDQHCRGSVQFSPHYQPTPMQVSTDLSMVDLCLAIESLHFELECVQAYAGQKHVRIINISLRSLFDSFPKGELGHEPFPYKRVNYSS